ncbi:prepilin peptidase [Gordonia sp. TBRC 11910]|uniref:Prepilin peptidase n=1 Tax=Gordonia asplenii TaxID=2725283 RepID=A0A848L362_9ACTN|nr:A24 family peptidase [Gordonia asplenii]NMO03001.1 prepilin peptidase [Gordonia asplenii]
MGESFDVVVAFWLLALAGSDARCGRLPNRWLVPAVVAVAASSIDDPAILLSAVIATTPYLAGFALNHVGAGDVKLAFVLGGMSADPIAALSAVLLAQITTVAWHVRSHTSRASPHGPALSGAAVLVWAAGG